MLRIYHSPLKYCHKCMHVRKGFTFIELIMVFSILTVLSMVAMADMAKSTTAIKLEAAKLKLQSDIIYAQQLAVTRQLNHGVIFNPSGNGYSLYSQNIVNIVDDPLSPGQPFTVNYNSEANFKGITFSVPSFGSRLEFDQWGIPYSDAGITALASNGTITLSCGGSSVTITVTEQTGLVY